MTTPQPTRRARPAPTTPPRRRAGLLGPLLLIAYFATPALVDWPYTGADPDTLTRFALDHTLLFYAGGWLQVTGALASIMLFLTVLQIAGARDRLAGAATVVGAALLLAVVTIEAALLEAVPMAAAGDHATVATTFALSNGVFARIFPLAPAPLLFAGIGYALHGTTIVPRWVDRSALAVAALFVLAGLAAILGTPGLIFAIIMSVVEALWIAATATTLTRPPPQTHRHPT